MGLEYLVVNRKEKTYTSLGKSYEKYQLVKKLIRAKDFHSVKYLLHDFPFDSIEDIEIFNDDDFNDQFNDPRPNHRNNIPMKFHNIKEE